MLAQGLVTGLLIGYEPASVLITCGSITSTGGTGPGFLPPTVETVTGNQSFLNLTVLVGGTDTCGTGPEHRAEKEKLHTAVFLLVRVSIYASLALNQLFTLPPLPVRSQKL